MRRTLITTTLLTAVGVALTGASTCGPQGPAARDFAAGSLVIPMDNCYQKRDASSAPGGQTVACNGSNDDGVFRAYGLVYFLLKHNVPVYWAIDNTKPAATTADVTATASSGVVAQKMSWADGSFADLAGLASTISYIGGPFIIDAGDVATFGVVSLLQTDPDFASFKAGGIVDVHKVQAGFHANQVRPLSGPPPKIAILNIYGPKTSADVMIKYAKAAGFDWTCSGACTQGPTGADCDCAGGISTLDSKCTKAYIASTYGITVNSGPGRVYDILCDADFLPDYTASPPDFSKATLLKKDASGSYTYKLLWAPHWETPRGTCPAGTGGPSGTVCGTTPNASAAQGSAPRNLADWLTCIRTFVAAGNNLFAECHAIVSLEGGYGLMDTSAPIKEFGLPVTQFETSAGMNRGLSVALGASTVTESVPTEPYMQIADFIFSVTSGNVSAFLADPNGNAAFGLGPSSYGSIQRYIAQNNSSPNLDVFTGIKYGGESGVGGSVIYLGGHDYSGQTAGTRIVLNTLFNLGFGCSDPNTTCTTGLLGACAEGTLKCAGGGGLQCVGAQPGALDCTTPGADANCNGILDQDEAGCHPTTCDNGDGTTTASGQDHACYDGPAGTLGKGQCAAGKHTCTLGVWGPCNGEVLPQPEVCNGLDDDCNGVVDDAPANSSLCASGFTCQSGICLPTSCNTESARCPTGFQCLTSGGACTGLPCAGSGGAACPAGKVCQSNQCVDPCQNTTCGPGSGCSGGQCVAGGCALTGCTGTGQVCVAGSCVTDPCAVSSCPTGTFCRVGPQVSGAYVADCVRSCSYVGCPTGETCTEDGFCQPACSPACGTGQVCVNGACAADPCAGVQCGSGQDCQATGIPSAPVECVDSACKHVTCLVGVCSGGQCVNGDVTTSTVTPIKAASSGGCGTGGGADLATAALLAAALATRRRRLAPVLVAASRRAAPIALALLLAVGASCSSKGGVACTAPQSACGADCADLQTSTLHCGACGHGCASGFLCVAGGCVLPTGNPHLVSVQPASIGLGNSPALQFTFDGLDAAHAPSALSVRLTGAVAAQELPLTLGKNGTATLPAAAIKVDGETVGAIEARLLNMPGRLVSNPVTIAVQDKLVARTLSPALGTQDQTQGVTLDLQGLGFVQGAVVSMAPAGGAPVPLATTYVSGGELTAAAAAPSTLGVGRYDVTVTNPDGAASSPLAFTVTDGPPTITGVAGSKGSCVLVSSTFSGTVTGTFLYPDSVVHVSGNSINNSPLDTSCLNGPDALGQCKGGQLRVGADLTSVPLGTYQVTVVNPGPSPLISSPTTITVAASCP